MATLYVRNLPDDLYTKLQELAASQHRSINAQVITLLEQALKTEGQQIEDQKRQNVLKVLEESRQRRRVNPADFGLPDSTELIREDRDR
ncbi:MULTISPECIES: FitA-like ribbon-helix-helix domain-containing protein [unclassified Nostoc]|uniref:FitA-like ribbon-helix-helix domain-containing protein n=1 Tax=unclassified Nostoc TaxID=2593658 RepID=UPI002AD2BA2B|nr:Arc family DNA-binding protein [Nostoc sp. DedQUE03]MDZ7972771.1 Arc family DNA-binding protein [Nostoc sp. DedQUE03]MDZ8046135.1 Arc family DNA-binding protein [Nostoc sp. DedQUE02]